MMGVPKISVSAKPMVRAIPNVLDLPVISGFVQSSIAAAVSISIHAYVVILYNNTF